MKIITCKTYNRFRVHTTSDLTIFYILMQLLNHSCINIPGSVITDYPSLHLLEHRTVLLLQEGSVKSEWSKSVRNARLSADISTLI